MEIQVHTSPRGITKIVIRKPSRKHAKPLPAIGHEKSRGDIIQDAAQSEEIAERSIEQLRDYFKGRRREFDLPLDLRGYSTFLRRVWRETLKIPFGEVRSYKWLAERAGNPRAVRAVGQAMRRNPIPIIIPCHRVVKNDGSLGGYFGGLELKRKFLELEGVKINNNRVIPL